MTWKTVWRTRRTSASLKCLGRGGGIEMISDKKDPYGIRFLPRGLGIQHKIHFVFEFRYKKRLQKLRPSYDVALRSHILRIL